MTDREALKRITRDDTEHGKYYYLADEVDALLAQPERCKYCDGTGDIHSIDGEWRGVCKCEAEKWL